jgi:hypothetical protein
MGLVYLLSLVALCTIPPVLELQSGIALFLSEKAPALVNQMPDIRITNGEVSIDDEEPYFILDEETGETVIIIDTTGRTSSLEGSTARILLTKSSIIVKKNAPDAVETFDLSRVDGLIIDRGAIYSFIDTFERWFAIAVYPFAVLFSFLYRVLAVLLYALVGKAFCSSLRIRLDYRALMRLSAAAITPSVVLGSLAVLFGIMIPLWWVMSWLITTGYLFFGVKSNAADRSFDRA